MSQEFFIEDDEQQRRSLKLVRKQFKGTNHLLSSKANLSLKKIKLQQLKFLFAHTMNSTLESLWLHWNQYQNMIQLVSKTRFQHLKLINLGGNSILSLDQIDHIYMPNLEELWLWNNFITSVKPLRRLQTKELRVLDLSGNYIAEIDHIQQIENQKLIRINLQGNKVSHVQQTVFLFNYKQEKTVIDFAFTQIIKILNKNVTKIGEKIPNKFHFIQKLISYY